MYVDEILDSLSLRLEDAEKRRFPQKYLWRAANNAQILIANVLNMHYLTELEKLDSNKPVSSNKVLFSALSNKVLRGSEGIINIKNHSGLYCAIVPHRQLKRTENSFLTGSRQNPLVWLYAEAIRCLQTLTALDVYYLKKPSPLMHAFTISAAGTPATNKFVIDDNQDIVESDDFYNGASVYIISSSGVDGTPFYEIITDFTGSTREITVSQNRIGEYGNGTMYFDPTADHDFYLTNLSAVQCELDPSLHELVVTFAEAECWKIARELERAQSALKHAIDTVKALNDSYEAAEGLGTKGRVRQNVA